MRRRDRSPRLFQSNLVCNTRLTIYDAKYTKYIFKMSLEIAGFIVALVLAALVIIWIAYCMFIRERHKSERFQYNIPDLEHRNSMFNQNEEEVPTMKKEITAAVIVLPSRHKQKDEWSEKRPDYPESRSPISHYSTDKLISMLDDDYVGADVHYRDGISEVGSSHACHSDV